MKIEYEKIEDIKTRPAIHRMHLSDNSFEKDSSEKMILLKGKHNNFPIITEGGEVTLSRPYEIEIRDDLPKIISQLKEDYTLVNLSGFPTNELLKYLDINYDESLFENNWYQKLLPLERYEAGLKKFKNKGLEFKILTKKDIPQLKELIGIWGTSKMESAFRNFNLNEINNQNDIENSLQKLSELQEEIDGVDFEEQSDKYYLQKMNQPITQFYGAFKEGELLAYSEIESNSNFASFQTRASFIQNSFSPQEFVDYSIMIKLKNDGVKLIDRGVINERQDHFGLIKYKEKFGKVILQREIDAENLTVINNPAMKLANRLQGNPYK